MGMAKNKNTNKIIVIKWFTLKKKVEETSIQEIVNEDLIMSSFTNMLQWLLSLGKNDNLTFLRRSFLPPHTPLLMPTCCVHSVNIPLHMLFSLSGRCFFCLPSRLTSRTCTYFFFSFYSRACSIWRFPGWGSNWIYSCQPTPQPQQCRIQTVSATVHSSWPCQILNPLSEAKDQTRVLMNTSRVR